MRPYVMLKVELLKSELEKRLLLFIVVWPCWSAPKDISEDDRTDILLRQIQTNPLNSVTSYK
jgi:hypothetical protein